MDKTFDLLAQARRLVDAVEQHDQRAHLVRLHQHVAPEYIENSPEEIGIPNVVTSVLASYRGYDTMGETAVIFTAGIGVLALLGLRRRRQASDSGKNNVASGGDDG